MSKTGSPDKQNIKKTELTSISETIDKNKSLIQPDIIDQELLLSAINKALNLKIKERIIKQMN